MSLTERDNIYFMSDSAFVQKNINDAPMTFKKHKHDFVEMVYVMRGKYTHTIDGKEYIARHGDMVIINYNQTHEIKGEGVYVNILMKPEYINVSLANYENAFALLNLSEFEDFKKTLDKSKTLITFSKNEQGEIENIIEGIIKEKNDCTPGYELAVRSRFNLLLIMIFRKMSLNFDNGFDGVSEKLLHYITLHCGENITLSSVAKMCSYNTSYFSRIFKEYTSKTFTSFLKEARIEKAANLILSTNLKIDEIAFQVGYSDKTKFFAHFKEFKGTTPLKLRKSKN